MSDLLPLPSLIRASASDAGAASMRKAGRSKWNDADHNAMVDTFGQLVTACYGAGPEGCLRFQDAERLERAGKLPLRMTPKQFSAALNAA